MVMAGPAELVSLTAVIRGGRARERDGLRAVIRGGAVGMVGADAEIVSVTHHQARGLPGAAATVPTVA